jgi:hypothetical protein
MSTSQAKLATPPTGERARELWLQHAAGYILFEDVRNCALSELDAALDPSAREVATRAVDAALYGLMQVIEGVTGGLRSDSRAVYLEVNVCLEEDDQIVQKLALGEGDGMCMGYHMWRQGDFGSDPIVEPSRP